MIPTYLQGKSAAQIVDSVKEKWKHRLEAYDDEDYIKELEMLLIVAVQDALCNADEEYTHIGAGKRASAFLNMVCPKEK